LQAVIHHDDLNGQPKKFSTDQMGAGGRQSHRVGAARAADSNGASVKEAALQGGSGSLHDRELIVGQRSSSHRTLAHGPPASLGRHGPTGDHVQLESCEPATHQGGDWQPSFAALTSSDRRAHLVKPRPLVLIPWHAIADEGERD